MKTAKVLALAAGFLTLGLSQAFAVVPTIDGVINPANEWENDAAHPYYLSLNDPNELDNQFNDMDIERVVLLQELDSAGGDGNPANDGMYLMVKTYLQPVSLKDPADGAGSPPTPTAQPIVNMSGDFTGDGTFDIHFRTRNTDALGAAAPSNDLVQFCLQTATDDCNPFSAGWTNFSVGESAVYNRGDVLEYFFPVGSFGTPNEVFPASFVGVITFDNGASGDASADDIVFGRGRGPGVIPEPGTMMLMGTGLLGFVLKKKKQQV